MSSRRQCCATAPGCEVQILDFTVAVRGGLMWPSTQEDTMTTLTTAQVGHGRKGSTVVEIDRFRGRLISADHADYDSARAVWNGAIDRYPRLIARCIGTADVVAAVRFARDHDLEIAVRGGGHNVAGTAVCDDGIVIDLSAMRAVRVDPTDRKAWVQGGALWGDVDLETQAHGLACPSSDNLGLLAARSSGGSGASID